MQLPPALYLLQTLDHCPKASRTYCRLWEYKDKNDLITVPKKDVKILFLSKVDKFEKDLLELTKEGLISFNLEEKIYHIELTGFDADAFE